ncbi:MAG TPA: hypothetical protein VGN63_17785 [Flavisolibacter sp.]|jgi:hypothetical protein|nr:hypothetical protein [Flavisolibacter sp.]
MSLYGYEIKTSLDLYKKLLDEGEDFLKNPLSSRFAMNCAWTGWHLHEWIFKEYAHSPAMSSYKKKEEFRRFLYKACPSLHTFRDLADGSKHFSIDQRPFSVLDTELKQAGSGWGYKKVLDSPTLVVKMKFANVGMLMTFDDLLYEVAEFWYRYLRDELNLDVDAVFKGYSLF